MLDTLLLLPLAILLHLTTPLPSSLNNDPSSLIICSVSGQIYTFDAYKGTPRGLFSSGSPLISSSSMDGSLIEQIIPGLDGNIYTLRQDGGGGVSMDVLPVSVQDVTSRPVSTCQNDGGECGILMGEKKSRVYALDVWSGKARWMSGKGWDDRKIWTSRGGASRKTVLLQREDYWVRMVDVDTGLEKWNVTVGNFAALDFGSSRDDRDTRRARVEGFQQKKVLKELGGAHVAWGVTEDNSKKKMKDVTTMKQIKFPSVAFGKDGMSVIAVDGTSGVFMWERRVDAVVAAVYGVGRENSWVPLKVIDESDILYDFPHSRATFSLPGPNTNTHPLIPYINQEDQMDDLLRIHSHDSALFLTSQPEPTTRPFIIPHIPQPLSLPQPSSEPTYIHPPPPYQKSHGLFLSWRMVFILTFTLSIAAFMARRAYIQQKQLLKKVTTQPKPSAATETNVSLGPTSSPSIPSTIPSNSDPAHSQVATKTTNTTTATTTINGIPFTHYSRYKSEFTEVSALGKGGFGTVFKCLNTLDGREYAVKKIYLKKENLEKVLREVKILALLDHPNIVRYYTAWLEVGEMGKQGDCWTGSTNCLFDRDDTIGSKESRDSHGVSQSANESSNFQRDDDDDDWGFHWDRSEGVGVGLKDEEKSNFSLGINRQINGVISEGTDDDSSRQSLGFHWQRSESLMTIGCGESQDMDIDNSFHDNTTTQTSPHSSSDSSKSTSRNSTSIQTSELTENKQHYILYIQMQLCSQKTIADYILDYNSSPKKTNPPIDIPSALKLFSQIARGVKHVHSRKLIHRDLKPSNCFMDDQGVVKIGDFGLSRESATPISHARIPSSTVYDENTGGIGTKSYASPEQIQGTDYDNKTDVYSLGIMLFELCYPMSTLMERGQIITKLRTTLTFPPNWHTQIKSAFPTLHTLLTNMLSPNPRHRPSSLQISHHIDSLLSEYTPHTLDKTLYSNSTTFLLRVEAHDNEGVLRRVLKLIRREHPSVEILQFGLRGVAGKMIIEVALSEMREGGDGVLETLRGCDEVMLARRVMGLETKGVVNDIDGGG